MYDMYNNHKVARNHGSVTQKLQFNSTAYNDVLSMLAPEPMTFSMVDR